MKKWVFVIAVFCAVGILRRLPHPARDISELEPVQLVYVCEIEGVLYMETDTGDRGTGKTLTEALGAMRAQADGEIFLETAEFLVLDPDVAIQQEFFEVLRPDCRVYYTERKPDLSASAKYLTVHPPELRLSALRAGYDIS